MSSLQFLTATEAGYGHINEDIVQVRSHPDKIGFALCSLADGQGGRSGGARAAYVAVRESLAAALSFSADALGQAAQWHPIVSAADEAVCEDDDAGFCTSVSLCVSDQRVCGASCGDSGALLLSGGRELLLTENQRKNPPVGSGAARPTAFEARLTPGWKLLVVSDGVWNYIGWEQIAAIAAQNQGEEIFAALRQAVGETNAGKLPDDFTIALFYNEL